MFLARRRLRLVGPRHTGTSVPNRQLVPGPDSLRQKAYRLSRYAHRSNPTDSRPTAQLSAASPDWLILSKSSVCTVSCRRPPKFGLIEHGLREDFSVPHNCSTRSCPRGDDARFRPCQPVCCRARHSLRFTCVHHVLGCHIRDSVLITGAMWVPESAARRLHSSYGEQTHCREV